MTRTDLAKHLDYYTEEYEDQLEVTRKAFSIFSIYEVTARDCDDYAKLDTDHLESLYSELELAIDKAQEFLEQLGRLCEASRNKDAAEDDMEYYEEHPEELEEE